MNEAPFRYRIRVRYAECDAQRVVFNGRYGDYVDLACIEFFRAAWGPLQKLLEGGLDYSLVHQELDWKAPARFDDVLELAVRSEHVGATSFRLRTDMRVNDDAAPSFTATTTYVLVDAKTLQKAPIPEDLRTALLRGAPGMRVDATGR